MSMWKLSHWSARRGLRAAITAASVFILFGALSMPASAQTILFTEDFQDVYPDVGQRSFTTIGEGWCDGTFDLSMLTCNQGLGYFASSVEVEAINPGVTFVGAPILIGARAANMLWDGRHADGTMTEDAWTIMMETLDWLVKDADPNQTTIRFMTVDETYIAGPVSDLTNLPPDPTEAELVSRLITKGYEVVATELSSDIPGDPGHPLLDPNLTDLDIISSEAIAHSTQWANSPIPFMSYQQYLADDFNTSNNNIPRPAPEAQPWEVTVTDSGVGHAALGGVTGTVLYTTSAVALNDVGTNPAPGADVPLTFQIPQERLLAGLAEAEELIAGTLNRGFILEGAVKNTADFLEAGGGNSSLEGRWFTGPLPGLGDDLNNLLNTDIGGVNTNDSFAISATGTFNVTPGTPQTFSFALSKAERADGGKLVVDGQTVIIDDGATSLDSFGTIQLGSGDHDFEWTAYHKGVIQQGTSGAVLNNSSFELSVSEIPDNGLFPTLNNFWEVVGDEFSTNSRISLVPFDGAGILGELNYNVYSLEEAGTPRDLPALLLFEEGAELHGGGITNFVGDYWGSVDTNHDWGEGGTFIGSDVVNRREMLFDGIDTNAAGSDPISISLMMGATPGGFEPSGDAFEVWVDPENDGSFVQVAHFAGDSNSNLVSKLFNPDTQQDLDWIGIPDPKTIGTVMQQVTISLPPTMNFRPNARIKIRSWSTWINELVAWDEVIVHTGSLSAGAPNGQLSLSGFGETHTEDFDSLGPSGSSLPSGWSATTGGTTSGVLTLPFPVTDVVIAAVYNAGKSTEDDRTLATGNVDSSSSNRIQLWGELTGSAPVGAVMLNARVEAWVGDALLADDPGEAAYIISLEFDPEKDGSYETAVTFNGGTPVTTGVTLNPGTLLGNSGPHSTGFISGLTVLASQIPAGSNIRLTFDAQGAGQTQGYLFGVDDLMFRVVAPGDTDGNGEVDSNDLFAILGAAKFNNPGLGPATWGEGDFTGDALVDSDDLFAMLGAAKFNAGPYTVESSGAAHSVMTATIDPATGIVTLDATAVGAAGEVVSGWRILSASGIFTGDAPTIASSFFNTDKDTEVSTGFIALTGVQELGSIIGQEHVGQSVGFYAGDISGDFTMDAAQGNFLLEIHVIPEPSSLMLAALGLVSLAGYGWRRRRTAA